MVKILKYFFLGKTSNLLLFRIKTWEKRNFWRKQTNILEVKYRAGYSTLRLTNPAPILEYRRKFLKINVFNLRARTRFLKKTFLILNYFVPKSEFYTRLRPILFNQ